jgi:general secretion pathway protein K
MAASTTFRGFVGIVAVDRDRVRADALLTAGLEIGAGIVGRLGDAPLPPLETQVALPGGNVRVRLTDEGGRIDVGKAPPEVLDGLFRYVGARDPVGIVERIVAARVPPPAFAEEPVARQPPAFTSLRELQQAAGVPPEVVAAIAPLATVFGNATVNPMSAPPEVLAALPGVDRRQLTSLLAARAEPRADASRLAPLLGPARQYLEATPVRAASVRLVATLPDGYAQAAQAVVVVFPDDSQPYRLLAWDALTSPGDDRP